MLETLYGSLGMVLGFSGLIFIHELGHFALAKWNGVRVYVFSLGMGPYLFSFSYKGTVYALSMVPIGGYVKMMGQDDMNAEVAPTADKTDYRNKRPGQKAAILAAGAIFNVIFALFAFTMCYWNGMYVNPPILGNVAPDKPLATAIVYKDKSPAHLQKGDKLIEVNHIPVDTFMEASIMAAGTPRGEDLWLKVERQPLGRGNVHDVIVKPTQDKRLGATFIGLERYVYDQELLIGFETKNTLIVVSDPVENSASAQAGLKKNDLILSIDDPDHPEKPGPRKLDSFDDFTNTIRGSQGRRLSFNIIRNNEPQRIDVTPKLSSETGMYMVGLEAKMSHRKVTNIDPESEAYKAGLREGHFITRFVPRKEESNKDQWTEGLLVWKKEWDTKKEESAKISVPGSGKYSYFQMRAATVEYKEEDFARALGAAWEDLYHFSGSVFSIVRGLFNGDVSHKALSGAIGIGQSMFIVASDQTFMNFLWFLGFISLNLGVLQFMPIPLLDGWHLLMLAVEKIKGGPIPMEWHIRFQYVGLVMIGGLLLLSFYNDISRLIFGA